MPRVPAIAKGNRMLTEIALQQHELNRFDTTMPALPGGAIPHVANNCLRAGLWEFYLTRPVAGFQEKFYHSWFEFPADVYRRLFRKETGLDYSEYRSLLDHYQRLEGLPVDLNFLRQVRSETETPPSEVETHQDEPVLRLPEQEHKRKLVVSENLTTYGDFATPDRQPIKLASFRPPGIYSTAKPVRLDLSFLGLLTRVVERRVHEPRLDKDYDEVELDFARRTKWTLALHWPPVRVTHGVRLVLGGINFSELPLISSGRPADPELARLTFGIGTPEVNATYAFRLLEHKQEPSNYLLLLDRSGKYVDNHTSGLDRIYLGRRSDGRVELYAVSYEREAIVAHWTLPPRVTAVPLRASAGPLPRTRVPRTNARTDPPPAP